MMRTNPLEGTEPSLTDEFNHRLENALQIITGRIARCDRSPGCTVLRPMLSRMSLQLRSPDKVLAVLFEPDADGIFEDHCRRLCLHLVQALDRGEVFPWVRMDDVTLSPDRAATVGLIVVALVTNALRYSSQGERRGTIWIDLRAKNPAVELIVSTSGPCRAAPASPPDIVVQLAETLSGEAFVWHGSEFAAGVRFPIDVSPSDSSIA